jgi:mannose-6-phosphate isomerase-like protein (cupin superfamily)
MCDQTIKNLVTGQAIRFIETDGNSLEIQSTYLPFSVEPPIHYHPFQDEYIQVVEGELTIRMNGEINVYRQGSLIHIPKNIRHSTWNSGFRETIVNWRVEPAMDTAVFLRTMARLSNEGATDSKGRPSFPVMVYLLKRYGRTYRLEQPAYLVQQFLYVLLFPIFCLKKFKSRFNNP